MTINAGSRPAVAPLDQAELRRLLACGGFHLAAVDDGRTVVGYLLAFSNADLYDGEEFRHFVAHIHKQFIYIDQVAVEPGSQRKGIARKLFEALIDHAKTRDIGVMCCEVNTSPPNPVSLDFHRRLGFASIGVGVTHDGRTVTYLVKTV